MNNYNGTLVRILGIFVSLMAFWFLVSFVVLCLMNLFGEFSLNIINTLWVFLMLIGIRIFYPRFIFTP